MNTYGERVKVTIFGESHGPAIGAPPARPT